MNLNLCLFSGLPVLEIGPNGVVSLAGGKAVGEFAVVIRNKFDGFLFALAADLDPDTTRRGVIRVIDGAEDQSVGMRRGLLSSAERERTGEDAGCEYGRETLIRRHLRLRRRYLRRPRLHLPRRQGGGLTDRW